MYNSHGDTVIYRSTEQRPSYLPRVRQPARRRQEQMPEPSLSERIAQLESRIAELEERLASSRADSGRRATSPSQVPVPVPGDSRPRRALPGPESVKVSVHAGNGAHATIGEIRMEQD